MDWELELMLAMRTVVATVLGGLVGLERSFHRREAGVRTYASVAMGACVFALISQHIPGAEPSRMAANIVVGVGFLGAGIIIQNGARTFGLTTAATVWATAAIGTGVGYGMYILSTLCTVILFLILAAHHLPWFGSKNDTSDDRDAGS
ncbi:MAG TPA: MgtC/SapB family protein [Woeseiaceae bacterium]|nr:MgtC/SapB family protein [Woeseiaceae bacterium]